MTAGPARLANATVIANEVSAGRRVDARAGSAFVDVNLTIPSFESCGAVTGVVADRIGARGAVETRRRIAFVHFRRAIVAAETGRADAVEAVDQIRTTAVVPARIRLAFVDVDAARRRHSAESVETDALVRVCAIDAT